MKTCFKCNLSKPETEFYRHAQMSDGLLGKCKDCAKKDVRHNYADKREKYAAYERMRFQTPERKAQVLETQRRRRARNPMKEKARTAVGNAIRDGRLIRLPCEECGDPKSEAHHTDYSKPLDVVWLCFQHHREEHGQVVMKMAA